MSLTAPIFFPDERTSPFFIGIEYGFPTIAVLSGIMVVVYLFNRKFWKNHWQQLVFCNAVLVLSCALARLGMFTMITIHKYHTLSDRTLNWGCMSFKIAENLGIYLAASSNSAMFFCILQLQRLLSSFIAKAGRKKKAYLNRVKRNRAVVFKYWGALSLFEACVAIGMLRHSDGFVISESYCLVEPGTDHRAMVFSLIGAIGFCIPYFSGLWFGFLAWREKTAWISIRGPTKGLRMLFWLSVSFLLTNAFLISCLMAKDVLTNDHWRTKELYIIACLVSGLQNLTDAAVVFVLDRRERNKGGHPWAQPFIKNGRLIINSEPDQKAVTGKTPKDRTVAQTSQGQTDSGQQQNKRLVLKPKKRIAFDPQGLAMPTGGPIPLPAEEATAWEGSAARVAYQPGDNISPTSTEKVGVAGAYPYRRLEDDECSAMSEDFEDDFWEEDFDVILKFEGPTITQV